MYHFASFIWDKHLFICISAICIASLMTCLFRSFAHFIIGLFIVLLLSFKEFFGYKSFIKLFVLQIFSLIL